MIPPHPTLVYNSFGPKLKHPGWNCTFYSPHNLVLKDFGYYQWYLE